MAPSITSMTLEKAKGMAINAVPVLFMPDTPPQIQPKPPIPMFQVPGVLNTSAAVLAASVSKRGSNNTGDSKSTGSSGSGSGGKKDSGDSSTGAGGSSTNREEQGDPTAGATSEKETLPQEKLDELHEIQSEGDKLDERLNAINKAENEKFITPAQAEQYRDMVSREQSQLDERAAEITRKYDASDAYENDGETLKVKPGSMCQQPTTIQNPPLSEEEQRRLLEGSVMFPDTSVKKTTRPQGVDGPIVVTTTKTIADNMTAPVLGMKFGSKLEQTDTSVYSPDGQLLSQSTSINKFVGTTNALGDKIGLQGSVNTTASPNDGARAGGSVGLVFGAGPYSASIGKGAEKGTEDKTSVSVGGFKADVEDNGAGKFKAPLKGLDLNIGYDPNKS